MKRLALALAVCAGLIVTGCASHSRALEAYDEGKYAQAAREWKRLAKRDNADAQYRLGEMYLLGQGVERSMDETLRWFRAAAAQGSVEARKKLGYIYLGGNAEPDGDPNVEEWITALGESGSFDIRYRVAMSFLEGEIVERDTDKAIEWFEAARKNWSGSKPMHARMADDGILREIADLGYSWAQFELGKRYAAGKGFPKSLTEAAKWYYLAGSQGHAVAQLRLGQAYARAAGVPKDFAEAARWYEMAAEQGFAEGQYQLGMLYLRGFGISRNVVEAHKWFNLAATKGHAKALNERNVLSENLPADDLAEAERLAVEWEPKE